MQRVSASTQTSLGPLRRNRSQQGSLGDHRESTANPGQESGRLRADPLAGLSWEKVQEPPSGLPAGSLPGPPGANQRPVWQQGLASSQMGYAPQQGVAAPQGSTDPWEFAAAQGSATIQRFAAPQGFQPQGFQSQGYPPQLSSSSGSLGPAADSAAGGQPEAIRKSAPKSGPAWQAIGYSSAGGGAPCSNWPAAPSARSNAPPETAPASIHSFNAPAAAEVRKFVGEEWDQ